MRGAGPPKHPQRVQPSTTKPSLSILGVGSSERLTAYQSGSVRARGSPASRGPMRGDARSPLASPAEARPAANAHRVRRSSGPGSGPGSCVGSPNKSAASSVQGSPLSHKNMHVLAVLQAAPLVHAGRPVDLLDHKSERDAITASIHRARRRVRVVCDFCTARRLGTLLTDGCRMLHYSGHGFSDIESNGRERSRLAFEDEAGGTHAMDVRLAVHDLFLSLTNTLPPLHSSHHSSLTL